MKKKSGKSRAEKSATNWEFLAASGDEGIDYSDIPKLGDDFWKAAKPWTPRNKDSVTLRLDHNVLAWFKNLGKGYQTRINAVLRSYVEHALPAKKSKVTSGDGVSRRVAASRSARSTGGRSVPSKAR